MSEYTIVHRTATPGYDHLVLVESDGLYSWGGEWVFSNNDSGSWFSTIENCYKAFLRNVSIYRCSQYKDAMDEMGHVIVGILGEETATAIVLEMAVE